MSLPSTARTDASIVATSASVRNSRNLLNDGRSACATAASHTKARRAGAQVLGIVPMATGMLSRQPGLAGQAESSSSSVYHSQSSLEASRESRSARGDSQQ